MQSYVICSRMTLPGGKTRGPLPNLTHSVILSAFLLLLPPRDSVVSYINRELLSSLKFALPGSLLQTDHATLRTASQSFQKAIPGWGHQSGLGRKSPEREKPVRFSAVSLGVPRITGAQYVLLFQSKAFA